VCVCVCERRECMIKQNHHLGSCREVTECGEGGGGGGWVGGGGGGV